MSEGNSILVVGGAGYLGCVLVEELLSRGYNVTVFDRLFFGEKGLEKVRDRIRLVAGDVRCIDPSILEKARAVVNLSGLSNDPTAEYNPDANYQMNTVAAKILAKHAKDHGIQRYVFASSCSIYDVGTIEEEQDIVLSEESTVEPHATYATSKLEAERGLFALADGHFAPVVLRMGTLFGFSPRMRYDLVVNTFVKDAISKGVLNLHYGGQMWRPLVDVRDAARAYITVLEADNKLVGGHIFNVVSGNYRISELGLRVRDALADKAIAVAINTAFEYTGVRNYRVSGKKMLKTLNYKPLITVEESVRHMVDQIRAYGYTDFDNDRYYNIRWMRLLEQVKGIIDITGTVFDMPSQNLLPGEAKAVPEQISR